MSKFTKAVMLTALASFGATLPLTAGDNVVDKVKDTVGDSKKAFALGFIFEVKSGDNDKFEAAIAKVMKPSRKEKGCLAYDLNRDTKDGQRYILYERWQNLDAFLEHTKSDHVRTAIEEFGDLLNSAPEVKVLWVVGE